MLSLSFLFSLSDFFRSFPFSVNVCVCVCFVLLVTFVRKFLINFHSLARTISLSHTLFLTSYWTKKSIRVSRQAVSQAGRQDDASDIKCGFCWRCVWMQQQQQSCVAHTEDINFFWNWFLQFQILGYWTKRPDICMDSCCHHHSFKHSVWELNFSCSQILLLSDVYYFYL